MSIEVLLSVAALLVVCLALIWNLVFETPRREKDRMHGAFRAIAHALELRCPSYTRVTDRVLELAEDLGVASGLHGAQLENLRMAVCLRDLGLTQIPFELMNSRPLTEWTDEDRREFFQHAEISAKLLAEIPSLRHLAGVVRYHHTPFEPERGCTGPQRFEIPLESRIIKVTADFAWYERTFGTQAAHEQLKSGCSSEYDPGLVNLLLGDLNTNRGAYRETVTA